MTYVESELASQPDCWREVRGRATALAPLLPPAGARVAAVGCGTSWFVAQAYAHRREHLGGGETDAFTASEFPAARAWDHVVLISRSGTTTEVLEAFDRIPAGVGVTVIKADAASPLVDRRGDAIVLDFADERSVVQTRFATTTLMLLRTHLGEDTSSVADDGDTAVQAPIPAEWLDRARFAFLGQGWTVGIANEAALKLRETSRCWTEAYPAMEYRHGPISVADQGSLVWCFGPPPAGLAADVSATSAGFVSSDLDPMADLIRAQRLGVQLAARQGYDPDNPRSLTRSVVLS